MYLPFDPDYFDSVPDSMLPVRDSGELRILFMGHVSKAKGALDLLEAMDAVIQAEPHVRLMLAGNVIKEERNITHIGGSKTQDKTVSAYVDRYAEHVKLLGIVAGEEKKRLLRSVDVLVLPSYSEGFPFAVLEAMCAGLPVIATPVGALPEVFTDGEDIRFVPIGDPAALGEAIIELARDTDLRKNIGANGRRMVAERFNLEVFSDNMSRIFNSLAIGSKAG